MWIKQSKEEESQHFPDCKVLPPVSFIWEPAERTVYSDLGNGTDVEQSDTLADSLELIWSEKLSSFHVPRIKKRINQQMGCADSWVSQVQSWWQVQKQMQKTFTREKDNFKTSRLSSMSWVLSKSTRSGLRLLVNVYGHQLSPRTY